MPNLDFEKEQVGLETVKDLGSKTVLDAFTCVECGRCQVNCPAWGAGKELNPKTIILQTQDALLGGRARDEARRDLHREGALAVHDLRRLREPVPGRHRAPAAHRSARGAAWCRTATRPTISAAMYNNLERRRQHLGPRLRPAAEVRRVGGARDLRSGAARRAGVARMRGRVRGRLPEVAAVALRASSARSGVTFGVLSKERCTGDPAKRTGNEYMFQELATGNIEDLKAAGPKKILTSCPHCVKTIGDDYRQVRLRGRDRALGGAASRS